MGETTTQTLVIAFKQERNTSDVKLTISVPNVDLTGPQIKAQTDIIVASNVMGTAIAPIAFVKEAYWNIRTNEAVDLEEM